MPYYDFDPESADEYGISPEECASGYQALSAQIDFARASQAVRAVREALLAKGFTVVRVRYDGGSDEGFSYFDFASVKGVRFSLEEMTELFRRELGAESPSIPDNQEHLPQRYRDEMERQWRRLTPQQRVEHWLEAFSQDLANEILGEGYGTGELSLRGQFRAELESGALVDLEDGEEVMAHPWHHAERSAKLFGGAADDYLSIHQWFDESKAFYPDLRHRALRHHSEGIFLCERLFGVTIENQAGKRVPVRLIGEQHVKDDLGWIPTVQDWLSNLKIEPWMQRTPFRPTHGLPEQFWPEQT